MHASPPDELPGDGPEQDRAEQDRAEPASSEPASSEIKTSPDGLIRPGGKVDPDALRAAIEQARESSDEPPIVRFELSRDPKQGRLDRYLCSRIDFMSRTQIQGVIDAGGVSLNGRVAKASSKLRRGDEVEIAIPAPPDPTIQPEEIPIDVLHEDEHLIILNKRPDIIVHPARAENSGTLLHALLWHFQNRTGGSLSAVGEEFARPGVVHRLDRNTTGCIVFAKSEEAHWKLGAQFEHRTADKRYLALVHGHVSPELDVIDLPIGPHPSKEKGYREKQVVRHDDLGKKAITICRVRERYRMHDRPVGDQLFSLVELELKTGRTHQIRVHLSDRGFPIVGDSMYGGRAIEAGGQTIERQMLHAALLAIEHPITRETLAPVAPPPDDFAALFAHFRTGSTETRDPAQCVPRARLGIE